MCQDFIHSQSMMAVSRLGFILAIATISGALGFSPLAMAQATPNIIVDLSFLNDEESVNRGKLALPPPKTPLSTLHVTPKRLAKIDAYAPFQALTKKKSMPPLVKSSLSQTKKTQPKKLATKKQKPPVPKAPSTAPVAKVTSIASPPPPPPPTVKPAAKPGPKVLKVPLAEPKISKPLPTKMPNTDSSNEEIAKAPATHEIKLGGVLRIPFEGTKTRIPKLEKAKILTLANSVRGKGDLRLQLLAYAGGQNLSVSRTRRMSLSRALAVRSLLIVNGVRSTQIDIRALGSKTDEKPINRVDLKLTKR